MQKLFTKYLLPNFFLVCMKKILQFLLYFLKNLPIFFSLKFSLFHSKIFFLKNVLWKFLLEIIKILKDKRRSADRHVHTVARTLGCPHRGTVPGTAGRF